MFAPFNIKVGARCVALAVALAASSFSAQAVLERVGPINNDPTVGGYPAWYQDSSGVAIEFCNPLTAAELNGGWCLMLPGDITMPEVFPTQFGGEHFYYAATTDATASLANAAGGRAMIVIAQEAAFAVDIPIPGDQIVFSRIRVWLSPLPVTGTYRFIHPYGEEILSGIAGERIFFTDDVGIDCNGLFDCAMTSRLGPFLKPSLTPGGAEMAPLTQSNQTPDIDPANFGGLFAPSPYPGTGKAYLADPNRTGPVTGSALPNFIDSNGISRNHNIFRIEGPAGSGLGIDPANGQTVDWVETTKFSLVGRVYDGAMPGKAKTDRATYTRNATGQKLDVFVTGNAATAARFPAQTAPAKVAPTLTFFNAPCAGVVDPAGVVKPPFSAPLGAIETQMFALGEAYWGQISPAVLPTAVCVKNGNARDAAGNLVAVFSQQPVTDEITVSQAFYDAGAGTLTVAATSSDTTVPPVLQVAYNGFIGPLVGGQIVVPNVLVPPSTLYVQSSHLGLTEYQVNTSKYPPDPAAGAPLAVSDTATFGEDSGPQILAVLANDTDVLGGVVSITSTPSFGTALLNANGTVTYTPKVNYNGTDSFTYTVTVGAQVSDFATVSLNVSPVNDAPVALNDTVSATVNLPVTFNVIANDTDPDGNADVVAATALSASTPAGATISGGAGGIVTFQAPTAGTYSFTYKAQDAAGVSSANTGKVTVAVGAPQTIAFNKVAYTNKTRAITTTGLINPATTVDVTFTFVNNAGTELGTIGTFPMSFGKLILNAVIPAGLPAGTTRLKATTAGGALSTFAISIK